MRFVEQRCDGLLDERRPGAPRKVKDAQVEEVVRKTAQRQPHLCTPLPQQRMLPASSSGIAPWGSRALTRATACIAPLRDMGAGFNAVILQLRFRLCTGAFCCPFKERYYEQG